MGVVAVISQIKPGPNKGYRSLAIALENLKPYFRSVVYVSVYTHEASYTYTQLVLIRLSSFSIFKK